MGVHTSQVSPALSIIYSIAQERLRLGDAYQGPQRVLLTWAARHKAEFTVLEASLMAICTCGSASPAIASAAHYVLNERSRYGQAVVTHAWRGRPVLQAAAGSPY